MRLLEEVRRWLRREGADAREAWDDVRRRGEADLDRRERQLRETPEEGVARLQDEVRANDAAFEELRRKLDSPGADERGQAPPPGREPGSASVPRSGPDEAETGPGPGRSEAGPGPGTGG